MLPNGWTELVALLAAFLISALTTPAGISGAVLLLPFQVSVLGTPGPSVTPTNLLYNVVSTPGALYRGLAAGTDRRPPGRGAHRRDCARRHRRIIYLHATRERDQAIAAGMGKLLKDAKKCTRPTRSGTQRARGRKHAS